jgi:hypothetical protein
MKKIAFALAAFGLTSGIATTVHAGDLAAYRGQTVDLGGVNGTAYTIEKGGYRVVATLADAGAKVMRFEAVLAPGQSVVLSSPAAFGDLVSRIEITRRGDLIDVQKSPVTN